MIITELSTSWTNWCRQLEQRLRSLEQKVDELTRAFEVTSELLCQVLDPQDQEIRYSQTRLMLLNRDTMQDLYWYQNCIGPNPLKKNNNNSDNIFDFDLIYYMINM